MEPVKNTWFLRCWAGLKPPRGSSATFRGFPEPMKNTWFSRRWDAGGPPEGSFWPFLRPPARSWRDPEAFLPYLRDFHGFWALRTGWFPRFWAAVTAPRCSLGPLRARLGVGFCGPRPCILSLILWSADATANDLPSWDFNRRCRRTYPGVCRSGFFLGGLTCL